MRKRWPFGLRGRSGREAKNFEAQDTQENENEYPAPARDERLVGLLGHEHADNRKYQEDPEKYV